MRDLSSLITGALTSARPIDDADHVYIKQQLPGIELVVLALPVPKSSCISQILSLAEGSALPRTRIFSSKSSKLLVERALNAKQPILCPKTHSKSFHDASALLENTQCSSIACIPLIPSTQKTSPVNQLPFGALLVAFSNDIITKDTVKASHQLAHSIAASHEEQLRNYAEHVAALTLCPQNSSSSSDDDDEDEDDNEDQTNLIDSNNETYHRFWLTFNNEKLESKYKIWTAQHLRAFEPASTCFTMIYFIIMAFSPSFAMLKTDPWVWAAGWIAIIPMTGSFGVLPNSRSAYIKNREYHIIWFHVWSIIWNTFTVNATRKMNLEVHEEYLVSTALTFRWHAVNLLLYQLRWHRALLLGASFFLFNTLPLLAPLCNLFSKTGTELPLMKSCPAYGVAWSVTQIFIALIILRLNEIRMRRLFLNKVAPGRVESTLIEGEATMTSATAEIASSKLKDS